MKIEFVVGIAGPKVHHIAGDVVDWADEAEAQRFIDAGIAKAVEEEKPKPRKTRKKRGE